MGDYIKREDAEDLFRCDLGEKDQIVSKQGVCIEAVFRLESIPAADVRPVVKAKNIGTDYSECDQFVCSNCGVELQDWHRVERDDDDGDITYHEYVFRYCPNCGAVVSE